MLCNRTRTCFVDSLIDYLNLCKSVTIEKKWRESRWNSENDSLRESAKRMILANGNKDGLFGIHRYLAWKASHRGARQAAGAAAAAKPSANIFLWRIIKNSKPELFRSLVILSLVRERNLQRVEVSAIRYLGLQSIVHAAHAGLSCPSHILVTFKYIRTYLARGSWSLGDRYLQLPSLSLLI